MRLWITCILTLFTLSSVAQKATDKYDRITDSLTRSGEAEKLISYFKKELKANPRSENILRRLGYLYIKDNQHDLGKKYYQDALALNPKCVRCLMNIALVDELNKDHKKALENFDKAIAIDPENPTSYSNRAHLKETTGDNSGALADYDKAVALDFENAGYYVQRGNYHFKRGSFPLAIADLNRSVQLAPDNYYPYYQRAIIYYNSRKISEALADVNTALQLDSTQQVLYTFRGAVFAAVAEHDKAIADYTKAIRLNPKDYLPYYNRSLEKHAIEDMDGSCADMQECYAMLKEYAPNDSLKYELEKSIGNYCDPTKPSYFYQRGIAFYNLQQFQKAIDIYTSGINKFPDNALLLSFRGNARFALKDYSNALQDYYAAVQHKGNVISEAIQNNISADTYADGFSATMQISIAEAKFALGQYDEALAEINKGMEMAPVSKDFPKEIYYNTRGTILLALGKYQQAMHDFDTCITLNISFPLAYVNRAVARINLSNKIKITPSSFSGNINNHTFNVNWTLPVKSNVKNSDENLFAALADCSKAIDIDPESAFAYYVRGRIKRTLDSGGQCNDFVKAKDLGYPVEMGLLSGCRQ
jgi:tetratricopeptide (TPR) repeat protein